MLYVRARAHNALDASTWIEIQIQICQMKTEELLSINQSLGTANLCS